jgi:DNA-damage-inducible protein J
MGQTTMSIRMDENIKKRFDIFCADAGMNATVAVNMFTRAVLREKRIPFEIAASDDPFYSECNIRHLNASIARLEAGSGTVHELIEDDEDE